MYFTLQRKSLSFNVPDPDPIFREVIIRIWFSGRSYPDPVFSSQRSDPGQPPGSANLYKTKGSYLNYPDGYLVLTLPCYKLGNWKCLDKRIYRSNPPLSMHINREDSVAVQGRIRGGAKGAIPPTIRKKKGKKRKGSFL